MSIILDCGVNQVTVDKMRCALAEVYPETSTWRMRLQQMPDRQVIAIYKNMSQNDKLYAHKKMNKKKREPGVKKAVQITMIDIAPEAFAR